MTKENKLIQYNLQDEAIDLRKRGSSYLEIAETLKKNHPKIDDIQKLSQMSVMRFLDGNKERELQEQVDLGGDPVKDLTEEFCTAVRDINDRSKTIYNYSMRFLDKLKKENKDNPLILKAIKGVSDSLAEERKNMIALKQFGEKRSMTIQNINLKKEIHVKNMLMSFSKDLNKELCPNCRAKMPAILGKLEEV